MIVVADSGPLIALARVDRLDILHELFGFVLIPRAVVRELYLGSDRPGSQTLACALDKGVLHIQDISPETARQALPIPLDPGETEALLLACQNGNCSVLIDEKKARSVARMIGLPIIGTTGVLVEAKRHGHLAELLPVLNALARNGYRLSPALVARALALAGES